MPEFKKVPKKYQPRGYEILYEDRDIIVGNKAPGFLTVKAKWERENTIHYALNQYVRKGSAKSRKCVFVVHRLDQGTSGILIFAKTFQAQKILKDHWKDTKKIYYALVHGKLTKKKDSVTSYLTEDDDYRMHSSKTNKAGKLAVTQYEVLKESKDISLLKIDLVTGRKNQIRVHMADIGHPVVGDEKYGPHHKRHNNLFLHAYSIAFKHPFSGENLSFKADVPDYFRNVISFEYS